MTKTIHQRISACSSPVALLLYELSFSYGSDGALRVMFGAGQLAKSAAWVLLFESKHTSIQCLLYESLGAGGKPSTWSPPGRLAELSNNSMISEINYPKGGSNDKIHMVERVQPPSMCAHGHAMKRNGRTHTHTNEKSRHAQLPK